jgi:hypothetical protein
MEWNTFINPGSTVHARVSCSKLNVSSHSIRIYRDATCGQTWKRADHSQS